EFIGGCDDMKALQQAGKLIPMLKTATKQETKVPPREDDSCVGIDSQPAQGSLFWFPNTVDNRVVRLVALQVFVIAIVILVCGIALEDDIEIKWLSLALLVDFVVRFVAGSAPSPVGAMAMNYAALGEVIKGDKPNFSPGPPKQFAAFVGVIFTTVTTILYFEGENEAASVVMGILIIAAGLEAFLGMCLGCKFFSYMIKFHLVPKTIYRIHINSRPELAASWAHFNERLNEGVPEKHSKVFSTRGHPSTIDLSYKVKTDAMTREDFHPFKHVQIAHFAMHLATCGLAVVLKFESDLRDRTRDTAWKVVAIISAAVFVIWLALYAIKWVKYPQKVRKEWMCPMRSNFFAVPPIVLLLLAFLLESESSDGAKALFWIGAPLGLLVATMLGGNWLAERHSDDHINPGWLIGPVGLFIAALVMPGIDEDYQDAAYLWFGPAVLMWIVLFTITFYRAVVGHNSDDRLRPSMWIWLACPAIAMVTYVQITGNGVDWVAESLFYMALGLFGMLSWGFMRNFFARHKFVMGYWAFGFPLDALAIAAIQYDAAIGTDFTKVIVYITLSLAATVTLVLTLHTSAGIIRRGVFIPDYKWGPMSFMKITHHAFREFIPRLVAAGAAMEAEEDQQHTVEAFEKLWNDFSRMHAIHSRHEEDVIFPEMGRWFPHVADHWDQDHEEGHREFHRLQKLVDELKLADEVASRAAKIGELRDSVKAITDSFLVHIQGEEDHLQPVAKRYFTMSTHTGIVRKVWNVTTGEELYFFFAWVVNWLPHFAMRVRFIKTFIWAMPEHAQLIGTMVALGVDPVQWKRLTDELPEIIPRGAPGWKRYF
ncbi:unnamed protein product, partial [Ostreobium quekettii]